jgi:hypothetical protein
LHADSPVRVGAFRSLPLNYSLRAVIAMAIKD